jgi:ABC-2 type transport system permease protein
VTTTVMTGAGTSTPGAHEGVAGRLSAAMNAEWIKLRSVRGPRWTLLAGFVATVGLGVLLSYFMGRNVDPTDGKPFEPVRTSFGGLVLGQLAMVVLGVTVIGGEYVSGMIRLSLAAVPGRGMFFAAKAAVLAAVTLAAGLATAFTAFFIGQAVLGGHGVSLTDPGVLRAVLAGALYPVTIALIALSVATMLRRQTLALGLLIPFFFLVSTILQAIPGVTKATQFLPDQAGQKALQLHHQSGNDFGPWTGLLICAAWVTASLLTAWLTLHHRDA